MNVQMIFQKIIGTHPAKEKVGAGNAKKTAPMLGSDSNEENVDVK